MRNEYSKALRQNMSWSEWVGGTRRMTWESFSEKYTKDDVKNILNEAGLAYKNVKTSTVQGRHGVRYYIRVYV